MEEIYDICKKEGYVLPTVYQGGFNPLQRAAVEGLFPTLRKLGIVFYAYSPLASGLLAKPVDEILRPKDGTRFKEMPVFGQIYLSESNLEEWRKLTRV